MAYMNQETKAKIAPEIKKVLAKYDLKGTLAIRHNATLVLTLKQGKVDLTALQDKSINHYHLDQYDPSYSHIFRELVNAMNQGNHDNSRPEFDQFDVGWYIEICVGRYDKPYKVV